jgi:DNA adenine methylase
MAIQFDTPLRYPGGKSKLANFVKLLYHQNELLDGHYVEPYAGGAGVALSLLFHEYSSEIHINDLSRSVYAFWYSALNETQELCRLIQDTKMTVEEWHRQKAIQEQAATSELLPLGFSTFFLNRTNRSGIINGGMIGGNDQKGNYKIDARYNKSALIERIKKIARYRCRINLYNQDASDFLKTLLPSLPNNSFAYLDPPYFVKGEGLYEDYYQPADHNRVSQLVSQINNNWMVSYDNTPQIAELYSSYRSIAYKLKYSAAKKYDGSEFIFFSHSLHIPEVINPSNVSPQMMNLSQESFSW